MAVVTPAVCREPGSSLGVPGSEAVGPTVLPASEPRQPQDGEGPQQTLLEVTIKEGSNERTPGAHEAGTVWTGTRAGLREPSGAFRFAKGKGSADSSRPLGGFRG